MLVLYKFFCSWFLLDSMQKRHFEGYLDFEAIASHTAAVLVDETGALLLGIVGGGEEHAFVALCLLVVTYAAWLGNMSAQFPLMLARHHSYLDFGGRGRLGSLEVGAHVGCGWGCYIPRSQFPRVA